MTTSATAAAIVLRRALPADALCLGTLATQVFLDTYATRGVNVALAREVAATCSPAAFEPRLADPAVEIVIAEADGHAVAFLDLVHGTRCPVAGFEGPEVLRLYVQAPFQRQGVGRRLLARAEAGAHAAGAACVWLTAWVGNTRALAFYRALGWREVGRTPYVIDGQAYENRVFAKAPTASAHR